MLALICSCQSLGELEDYPSANDPKEFLFLPNFDLGNLQFNKNTNQCDLLTMLLAVGRGREAWHLSREIVRVLGLPTFSVLCNSVGKLPARLEI